MNGYSLMISQKDIIFWSNMEATFHLIGIQSRKTILNERKLVVCVCIY